MIDEETSKRLQKLMNISSFGLDDLLRCREERLRELLQMHSDEMQGYYKGVICCLVGILVGVLLMMGGNEYGNLLRCQWGALILTVAIALLIPFLVRLYNMSNYKKGLEEIIWRTKS